MTKSMKDELAALKSDNEYLTLQVTRLQTELDRRDAQMDIISIILDKARSPE